MGVNSFLIVLRSTGVVKMEILTCGVKWNRVGDEVFESENLSKWSEFDVFMQELQ